MTDNNIGPFNEPMLKKLIKIRLQNEIDQIAAPRCIYGQADIIHLINFVYDFKFQSNYFTGKIYSLEYDHEATDIDKAANVIYFLYPTPIMIDVLASMIFKNEATNIKKTYWVYFIPFSNYLCVQKMEQLGIVGKIRLKNLNFDLIPINQDLFSLEVPKYLDPLEEDNLVIESIMKINKVIGKIKNCYALGKKSVKIMKILEASMENIPEMEDAGDQSYMIVLDRALDYITPMMTPFSYEGLLDLFFGISLNQIQIPGSLMDSTKTLDTFLLYNPKDKHYKNIAPMYIKDVPDYLKSESDKLSKKIKQQKDAIKTIQDLNEINQNLMPELILMQYHKSIVSFILMHLNECQFINTATLESACIQTCQRAEDIEYLSIFYPIEQVMKLEVLSSQISDIGNYFSRYEKKIYQFILDSYHPKHLITVKNLVDKGILRSTKQPLKWKQMCQKFDLIPDQPRSYTYIHIIYSALLVRFVQMFLTDNLKPDSVKLLSSQNWSKGSFKKIRSDDRVYLYIIGGITYPEIEAFRILGQKLKLKFIICTTEVTSGQKIIKKCF